ncbi:MAG: cell division protein SepF [Euryarchaeota archaeon]|nr:cell division protein SepF [Euryarchaeota archaeon]
MSKGFLGKLFGEYRSTKNFEDYIEVEAPGYDRGIYSSRPAFVKTARLKDFTDVQKAIEELNQGNILVVNVQAIASKDAEELKRALETLKGVCQSIGGDIAGIDKDRYILTPQAVKIYREEHKA